MKTSDQERIVLLPILALVLAAWITGSMPNPASAGGLGAGYDYDVIDSGVISERMEFKDGRLVLPHGVLVGHVLPHHRHGDSQLGAALDQVTQRDVVEVEDDPAGQGELDILVGEETRELIDGLWPMYDRGLAALKGIEKPIKIYSLLKNNKCRKLAI